MAGDETTPAEGVPIEVSDLAQMRAMVHPARWAVLQALYEGEPLTATQAAELTGLTPSAMSYHLQQLAKMGLVERAPTSGDGRERPWRARGTGLRMSAQPDEFTGSVMMRYLLTAVTKVVAAPPPADSDERPWPASYTHARIRLTKDQLKRLHQRVQDAIDELTQEEDDTAAETDFFWISGVRVDHAEAGAQAQLLDAAAGPTADDESDVRRSA